MGKSLIGLIAVIFVFLGSLYTAQALQSKSSSSYINSGSNTINNNVAAAPSVKATGETQTVKLVVNDGLYEPREVRVKAGTKLRIETDPSGFVGCMTTFIVDGYNIRKRISGNDNVVEFVADKPGTFSMHCPMGMGDGKIIVEDATGSVPQTPIVKSTSNGGSCGGAGGSGGGCGCGGG